MTGFIVENVQVATLPYIDSVEDEEQPNPLLQLVSNRGRTRRGSQNVSEILGGLEKLEKKIKKLERRIPSETSQQRLWVATHKLSDDDRSHDDSYNDEDGDVRTEEGHSSGSGRSSYSKRSKSPPRRLEKGGSPGSSGGRGSPKARVASRPIRLEKEERSCFARLLFSRCWTGKDLAPGWTIKRRCPKGEKVSLSCPCGEIGPCKKLKSNPVPIDKLTSTPSGSKKDKKKKNKACSGKSSRKQNHPKNQDTDSKSPRCVSPKNCADLLKAGKPLYEKLLSCCFKDHNHAACCCRCKDNPPLKSSSNGKSKEDAKNNHNVASAKDQKREKNKSPSPRPDSSSPSEDSGDEGYYDNYKTYNIRSVSNIPKNHERKLSRKQATSDMQSPSKRKDSRTKIVHRAKDKETKSFTTLAARDDPVPNNSKSTTSFEIMLHPHVSNDQIVEPDVVSHQILKTLSTIHGPVKVEQKIVVQGSENSVVIVTHGEACQCNLCHMLKGGMRPKESIEGSSPQVVKISTDSGYNTLISHSDGCRCDLCLVLDPVVMKDTKHRTPRLETESLVMTATEDDSEGKYPSIQLKSARNSHSNDGRFTGASSNADTQNRRSVVIRTDPLNRKSNRKTISGKKKVRKCRCTKCQQRRRVEKLKLRLKKEVGAEEYNEILQEITRRNEHDEGRKKSKHGIVSIPSESDDNDIVEPKRTKKRVSFSPDPDPRDREERFEERGWDSNVWKRRCKLCELTNVNVEQRHLIVKRGNDTNKHLDGQNHNSTVYSINESSHDAPCEYHMYDRQFSKEISDDRLRFASKPDEMRVQSFIPEQTCFPPKRKRSSKQQTIKDKVKEESSTSGEDASRSQLHQGRGCSEKCRRREDVNNSRGMENPGILLQEGAFPQKFVFWAPGSRSNMATAYSSDSYYVPDQDEFPIMAVECDDSVPSSTVTPPHRVHIPVFFRKLPDRKNS